MNIGIYLNDNAEVLYFAGPFEVFSEDLAHRTARQMDYDWKPDAPA